MAVMNNDRTRYRAHVEGVVQGVGFRPFVFRLAHELSLTGFVENTQAGVDIEVEGPAAGIRTFLTRLRNDAPPLSAIESVEGEDIRPRGTRCFAIRTSENEGAPTTLVMPDIATCPDCLAEIHDPMARRYGYPFTNCTRCGPRYTIIHAMPYDRLHTSMRGFPMCAACRVEYDDPMDRRFHAQPIACPACGPVLTWATAGGAVQAQGRCAIEAAAEALIGGAIVAVKGIGGFQLMVDARDGAALARLRQRKQRDDKPFAVMFPAFEALEAVVPVSAMERALLQSPEAPIVLLGRAPEEAGLAENVAPRLHTLGAFLPYTPLHTLLMEALEFPVVATSGNRTDEPMCTDNEEALQRLAGIADFFLMHDRPIVRYVDDSVVRVMDGAPVVLRRARGYAPLPLVTGHDEGAAHDVLALGGQLKNTVAVARKRHIFLSQHVGDLETQPAYDAFRAAAQDLPGFFGAHPACVAVDMHPAYLSTQHAWKHRLPIVRVQHHYAHVLAAMAEHGLEGPILGVSWDGTGYGADGVVWGGEFLRCTRTAFTRVAHLRPFPLPGSELAVREPRRAALGLLYALFGREVLDMADLMPLADLGEPACGILCGAMESVVNAPRTTSVGRLFDAVASLVGLRQQMTFEGQAAMELEQVASAWRGEPAVYSFEIQQEAGGPLVLDWAPLLRALIDDVRRGTSPGAMARGFHEALAAVILETVERLGDARVVLTGGCFQNALLLEATAAGLRATNKRVFTHRLAPPNDGGIALGQAWHATAILGDVKGG